MCACCVHTDVITADDFARVCAEHDLLAQPDAQARLRAALPSSSTEADSSLEAVFDALRAVYVSFKRVHAPDWEVAALGRCAHSHS